MEPLAAGDPAQLGPWRVHARLGAGGMGTVYLGEDDTGQRAAVKQLRPELAGDAAAWARFRREIALAQRVEAACVAGVLDVDTESSSPYVAFEFVDGVTLAEHITTHGPLSEAQLHALAIGLADALAAIHDADIVHRDLSPNNVLLTADGPRVVDFGIARPADAAATAVTGSSSTVGTPGWMAPEQARGDAPSQAGDVFSWGCLIAYAAGQLPFGHGRPDEVLYRTVHEPPDLPTLPSPLDVLVPTALAKSPHQRPSTATLRTRLLVAQDVDTVPAALHATWDVAVDSSDFPAVGTAAVHRRKPRRAAMIVAAVIAVALIAVTSMTVLAPGTTRDLLASWGWGSSADSGNENAQAAPAPVTSPTPTSTPTPTPTPTAIPTPTPSPEEPDEETAPWDTEPIEPDTPQLADVVDQIPDGSSCPLYAPQRLDEIARWTGDPGTDAWWGYNEEFGRQEISWNHETGSSLNLTVHVDSDLHAAAYQRAVDRYREQDPEPGEFSDGTTLYEGWDGHSALLVVPREGCAYELATNEAMIWNSQLVPNMRPIRTSDTGGPPAWVEEELAQFRTGYELENGSHWDPSNTLNVVTGWMGGASDRGRFAFFFVNGQGFIGTDTAEQSQYVFIDSTADDMATLEYVRYHDGDPACCPTADPKKVRFQWTGEELRPLDEIPPLDGPVHR